MTVNGVVAHFAAATVVPERARIAIDGAAPESTGRERRRVVEI